jgi:hypothetical protein
MAAPAVDAAGRVEHAHGGAAGRALLGEFPHRQGGAGDVLGAAGGEVGGGQAGGPAAQEGGGGRVGPIEAESQRGLGLAQQFLAHRVGGGGRRDRLDDLVGHLLASPSGFGLLLRSRG